MPIVATIIPNDITFENMIDDDITNEKLTHLVSKLVTLIHVPDESTEMFQAIGELIDPPDLDDVRICTAKCYESYDNMLFMMSCNYTGRQENKLCRYMNVGYKQVYGTSVFATIGYDKSGKIMYTNTTIRDIVNMLLAKMRHQAILITPDNHIQTLTFARLPIENTTLTETNSRSVPIEFLGRNIVMFMEMIPTDDRFNLYATILGKKQRVHGDVVISMVSQHPMMETLSLGEELFQKILVVMSHHDLCRTLKYDDNADPNTNNFYRFLEERYSSCDKQINTTVPDDVMRSQSYNSTLHT
jgi:hypothetical protein